MTLSNYNLHFQEKCLRKCLEKLLLLTRKLYLKESYCVFPLILNSNVYSVFYPVLPLVKHLFYWLHTQQV
jgi:hypothetical protein